ncbi:4-hydroxyphenylpyruvate dioxygenase [Actinoplanes italicus]|uniref:4-hydroxymandelate synthase n=1 Tax=Actinoplanes italicus TaxID=113567 RepID=A0A2T0K9E9_9ACTN|nr:4-hydroxyphenylpyruvate dioxygenase [Actinoplanes italicus]PRX19416.1 4-hydroxymandelate synthase [Actinoplanes italicus]GIE30569.1 4-hydroxyphenylpyruvate dioxygenase [Actinoplanes italicus]
MREYGFEDLTLDHVKFYVSDAEGAAASLSAAYGLGIAPTSGKPDEDVGGARSALVGVDGIRLVLTEAVEDDHPARAFVEAHGDGVSDVAIAVDDVHRTFAEAVRGGARVIARPAEAHGVVTAAIGGFGDVIHTLVQRPHGLKPGPLPDPAAGGDGTGLHRIDHFAVCVEAGQLQPTVGFYQRALGFDMTFEERITVGRQAMNSMVVQSPDRTITFTILEPDRSRASGQIDDFLKNHGGPGVQHIAFTSDDIVTSIERLRDRGVEFLSTPASYYEILPGRIEHPDHAVPDLRRLDILVDADHGGQLFQIFARSTHPRRTYFFEIIERQGARTFGSGNIKALYEAVELESERAPELP